VDGRFATQRSADQRFIWLQLWSSILDEAIAGKGSEIETKEFT
jgi:hypothetical protein